MYTELLFQLISSTFRICECPGIKELSYICFEIIHIDDISYIPITPIQFWTHSNTHTKCHPCLQTKKMSFSCHYGTILICSPTGIRYHRGQVILLPKMDLHSLRDSYLHHNLPKLFTHIYITFLFKSSFSFPCEVCSIKSSLHSPWE